MELDLLFIQVLHSVVVGFIEESSVPGWGSASSIADRDVRIPYSKKEDSVNKKKRRKKHSRKTMEVDENIETVIKTVIPTSFLIFHLSFI